MDTAQRIKIIFMGTPEFAVPSLRKLVENQFNIVAVITAPDKPQGRGKKLGTSPVKDYALSVNLPVLQPTNLKSPEFVETLQSYEADLQVIVAFRMLPEVVWSMPTIGSFNLHASLLPQYRGAAPINWAVINGEKESGVTTFMLKHEIDTGNILYQQKEPIYKDDTAGTLYERLMNKGADLVVRTVQAIESNEYQLIPQKELDVPKHAPKIFRQDCEINWAKTAEGIRNFVRGLNPFPAAWTTLDGKTLKVLSVEETGQKSTKPPGTITSEGTKILVHTGDEIIHIKELQLEGKRRMKDDEFLRGHNLQQSILTFQS